MKRIKSKIVIVAIVFMMMCPTGCDVQKEERSRRQEKPTEETHLSIQTESQETVEETRFREPTEIPEIEIQRGLGHIYDMDIILDVDSRQVGGTVVVEVFNDSTDIWHNLCFRDYPSVYTSAEMFEESEQFIILMEPEMTVIDYFKNDQGEELSFYRDEEDFSVIFVELDEVILPGERRSIEYSYTATVPIVADRFGTEDGYFNMCHFYLILAVYEEDKGWSTSPFVAIGESFYSIVSDYSARILVPEDYTVISTGVVTNTQDDVNGGVWWFIDAPCVRDFTFVAGPDFNMLSDTVDGILVKSYYMGDDVVYGEQMLIAGIDSIRAFNEAFGKYPYPEINVVQTPLFAGGMEYAGLVMIGPSLVYGDGSNLEEDYYFVRLITAHEVGHQWFYGIIGNDPYEEPWLDESFASFTEYVYFEAIGKAEEAYNQTYVYRSNRYSKPINQAYYEYFDAWEYFNVVYNVGGVMLYDLRDAMGEDVFYDMMRNYVARHAFENVTQDDFLNAVYEFSGTENEAVNQVFSLYLHIEPPEVEALDSAA